MWEQSMCDPRTVGRNTAPSNSVPKPFPNDARRQRGWLHTAASAESKPPSGMGRTTLTSMDVISHHADAGLRVNDSLEVGSPGHLVPIVERTYPGRDDWRPSAWMEGPAQESRHAKVSFGRCQGSCREVVTPRERERRCRAGCPS